MPPVTLNRAQFQQTPAARKPGASYSKYLSYVARNRPARIAQNADPLRPLSPPEIRRDVTGQVNAQINPVLAEITRSITSRANAGQNAIRGYTDRLASELGSYQESAGNIYGAAQRAQAAADAALAQRLSGQGGQLAEQLAQRFSSAGGGGDPGVARQTGEGASGALYATGSAALSDLISRGAGEQAYAAKLPGLAKLAGVQGVRDLQLGAQRDLADETGRVRQQVPGMISELLRSARGDEIDKQVARLASRDKRAVAEAEARAAAIDAAADAREKQAARDFELRKLRQQQAFETRAARRERQEELADADRDYRRSRRDKAAERAYNERKAAIERRHKEKLARIKQAGTKKKKTAAGEEARLLP